MPIHSTVDRLQNGTVWRNRNLRSDTAEEVEWNRFVILNDDGVRVRFRREPDTEPQSWAREQFLDNFVPA